MYNVCKYMHKLGMSIKKFVKMGSITADQYETITGKKYEQLTQAPRSIFRAGRFFNAKKLPPNIKLEGKTVASNQLAIKV